MNVPPADIVQTFEQRLTDAVDIRIPQLLVLTNDKRARVVARWPWQFVVVARTAYLDAHPGVAARLREVLIAGASFIANHPEEAADWWGEFLHIPRAQVLASADLNPLYHLKRPDAIHVTPSAAFHAIGGMGRRNETTGSSTARASPDHARIRASGTDMAAAARNSAPTRCRLPSTSGHRLPSTTATCQKPRITAVGEGSRIEL